MAEAEDVITDAARHATVYAQALWRRHRPAPAGPAALQLADMARRLDLLVAAAFGLSLTLRAAQPPARPSWIGRKLLRHQLPVGHQAIPATDGRSIWLPASLEAGPSGTASAAARYCTLALQQAMRAERGSPKHLPGDAPQLERELYLLLEARAADAALASRLPGMAAALVALRKEALALRPPLEAFPASLRLIEQLARAALAPGGDTVFTARLPGDLDAGLFALPASPAQANTQARALASALGGSAASALRGTRLLWRDAWTGDLRATPPLPQAGGQSAGGDDDSEGSPSPRSARLSRRPEVRDNPEDEDDGQPGAWMVQTAQPQEKAEDPMGLQRPTDRDQTTASEDFADALSELPEARLVSAPGKPKEVLISDDPPEARTHRGADAQPGQAPEKRHYPEWDWRLRAYRDPGATVLLLPAPFGPQQWVDDTLAARRSMLHEIRRRFELLRAQRTRLRRQLDGDDIDLQAYIESQADFRAGLPMAQRLYQTERRSRRDMAVMLLVDVSGSTDGWITADKRIIDVEREALLLVCLALDGMADPYSVLAFSGEGPQAVVVRSIKRFDERYDSAVAQRIAGLEPEHYTRAGAALRHACSLLMREPAEHRLLLLLSDGKPNDVDDYEGRYGVEDMRQAVLEAKLQGISPFCLTIDRQAANYLPAVFGPHHYALLPRPELLPGVLLDWLRRLVAA
ncbi:nitric oxide reductase activation protein NorD [Polaromonas glacialis]|uniref:nitric oxide reductase activation protein NorD n=1 Tax=Polaromonas glacialis TaxID=866564 RepID=UPI000497936A|nr:VWA domain-containing protein [Polaromonas glacialis]